LAQAQNLAFAEPLFANCQNATDCPNEFMQKCILIAEMYRHFNYLLLRHCLSYTLAWKNDLHHSVVISEIYSPFTNFWQKFRESNAFTKEISKEMI